MRAVLGWLDRTSRHMPRMPMLSSPNTNALLAYTGYSGMAGTRGEASEWSCLATEVSGLALRLRRLVFRDLA